MNVKQIDSDVVHLQLERICNSKEFTKKSTLCSMLNYLVKEHLAGRSKRIKGYSIATDVFGRDEDFDPDQNSLVRIHAGRLRRQLRLYYLDAGKNDPIIIEIPKGRYIPRISENTYDKQVMAFEVEKSLKQRKPKLSVLPFQNLTENSGLDYLATGFSQELSEALTKFEDFSVIGINLMASQMLADDQFLAKLKEKEISYLIEGKLQEIAGQLLLRFRLIDAKDNSQLWAGKFKFASEEGLLYDELEKFATRIATRH